MSKYTGKGGQAVKDGTAIAQVVSYTWSESQGNVRGQTQSDVSMEIYLDGAPLRVNDSFVLNLKTRDGETNYIKCGTVKVESVSVPISQDNVTTQSVNVIGLTTAVYASIT
jgi:hypothetical protein